MLKWFAGDQIRNVSAIGGNLMTASPISDLTPIIMAAGGTVEYGQNPEEIHSAIVDQSFFTGYRKTLIPNTSTLLNITIPHTPENGFFLAYKQAKLGC
jgi:xanthine dehydrogenase/oxidase